MALDASSSLGAAIGLTGTPKDYSAQFGNMAFREEQARANQQAKKQAKEDQEKERLAKMFTVAPGKYLPSRDKLVKDKSADFVLTMSQAKRNGVDPKSDPNVQQKYAELTALFKNLEQESADLKDDYDAYLKQPQNFKFDTSLLPKYATATQAGDDVELYVKGRGLQPTRDWRETGRKIAGEAMQRKDVIEVPTADGSSTTTQVLTPEEVNKKIAADFVNSGLNGSNFDASMFVKEAAQAFASIESNNIMSPEEKEVKFQEFAQNQFVDYMKQFQDQELAKTLTQKNVTNVNVNVGGTGTGGQAIGTGPKEFNITYYNENGFPVQGITKSIDGSTFGTAKVKSTLPSGTINMATNEPIKKVGSVDLEGGEVQVVYMYKKGVKGQDGKTMLGGTLVPESQLNDEVFNSGVVEAVPIFIGNMIEKDGEETKQTPFIAPADKVLKNYQALSEGKDDKAAIQTIMSRLYDVAARRNKEMGVNTSKSGSLTTKQQAAASAFEQQFGRKPTPVELAKIKSKY